MTKSEIIEYLYEINTHSDLTIEQMASDLADRPQGEWVESFEPILVQGEVYLGTRFIHKGWSCSECGEVVEKRYPNCPYCLARMKGADDDSKRD